MWCTRAGCCAMALLAPASGASTRAMTRQSIFEIIALRREEKCLDEFLSLAMDGRVPIHERMRKLVGHHDPAASRPRDGPEFRLLRRRHDTVPAAADHHDVCAG